VCLCYNAHMDTKRQYKTYSEDEKAAALAVYVAEGRNLSATKRATGIPRKTLAYWIQSAARETETPVETVELRQQKKSELASAYLGLAREAAEALRKKLPEMSGKDLAIAIGILTDKVQLLTGDVTQRTEITSPAEQEERLERLRAKYGKGRAYTVPDPAEEGDTVEPQQPLEVVEAIDPPIEIEPRAVSVPVGGPTILRASRLPRRPHLAVAPG